MSVCPIAAPGHIDFEGHFKIPDRLHALARYIICSYRAMAAMIFSYQTWTDTLFLICWNKYPIDTILRSAPTC